MTDPSIAQPKTPGSILKRELEARGWTQKDLAEIIDRPAQVITEIVRGTKQITPDTAMELAAALGTTPDFWTDLETQYRLHLARARHSGARDITQRAKLFAHLPIAEMVKRRWIKSVQSAPELQHEVMHFLGVTDLNEEPPVFASLRRSSTAEDIVAAQRAWVRRVEVLAARQKTRATYSARKLTKAIPEIRAHAASQEGVGGVPDVLSDLGIRFVIVESLPRTKIDGAALFPKHGPILALSMRFDRIDYFWFTLMHEVAHLALEHRGGHLDVQEDHETIDGEEKAANSLAETSLISSKTIRAFVSHNKPISKQAVEDFAKSEGVHPGIVVGRLHHDGDLPWSHMRSHLVKVADQLSDWTDR